MPARIVVIEDNPENLELMSYLLRAFQHTVFTARDGIEGLQVARDQLPHLILCDLQMPKLDGYGLAQAVRNDPHLAHIPLVAVTAYAMNGDRDQVLAAGFDGYISKPIAPEEFVDQVERFLQPNGHGQFAPAGAVGPTAFYRAPAQRRTTLLVVDNSPVNLTLMQSTLEAFGYRVRIARSVREGLKLAREIPPSLILCDLHMPEVDGYGLLKAVREDPRLRMIPVAMISSTVWQDTDPAIALGLGADTFIVRPIDPQELVDRIEACLARRSLA